MGVAGLLAWVSGCIRCLLGRHLKLHAHDGLIVPRLSLFPGVQDMNFPSGMCCFVMFLTSASV